MRFFFLLFSPPFQEGDDGMVCRRSGGIAINFPPPPPKLGIKKEETGLLGKLVHSTIIDLAFGKGKHLYTKNNNVSNNPRVLFEICL